eukprot:6731900-Ditylum_brightwellii.AAC.1
MRLEKSRKGSSGKRTCYINIGYFGFTDRIAPGEITVEYCPRELMVTDFYTKSLQGKLFRIFCNMILNLEEDPCTEETRHQILKQQQETTLNQNMIQGCRSVLDK